MTGICCDCDADPTEACSRVLLTLDTASRLMPPHGGEGGATEDGSGVADGVAEEMLHSTIGFTGRDNGGITEAESSTELTPPLANIGFPKTLAILDSRSRRPMINEVFSGLGSWALVEKYISH